MLDEVFSEAGCRPSEVDVVGFSAGPGSFTGARIAAALTQAVALAADARVVAVATSRVWAHSASVLLPGNVWVVSVPSRGDAFYLSLYRVDEGMVVVSAEDVLCTEPPEWIAEPELQPGLVGTVPPWLPEVWRDRHKPDVEPRAADMLSHVELLHTQGRSAAPEFALPTYIAGDSPWRKQGAD